MDAKFTLHNVRDMLPGYFALVLHALAATGLDHVQLTLAPTLEARYITTYTTIGAFIFGLVPYGMRELVVSPFVFFSTILQIPIYASFRCPSVRHPCSQSTPSLQFR
jgi:hypothetical protein